MIDSNTVRLMRIPFSFFLMPIYWFAISQTYPVNWVNAIIAFVALHLFVYPASNGYNSYIDQDETSIGGLKNPPKPTKSLFYLALLFDIMGLLLSLSINVVFFIFVLFYILVSRAYSSRAIRLKKYPIVGFLTVAIFQGGFTYLMVKTAMHTDIGLHILFQSKAMWTSTLLIAGVYPLTQVYQHKADAKAGDKTLSILLGVRGTFMFSAICFVAANLLLWSYFAESNHASRFMIFQLFLLPVVAYFIWWATRVWKNVDNASFENMMKMNALSSTMMSSCFILFTILNYTT